MNLSSFCSNRCGCTSWEVICWSDAPGNKALLCNSVCAGFHGLDASSASSMMLKSAPNHSKCFVPLSCKHLQLHMTNDNKTYQLENPICKPINPTSTNNMKLFLICCLPLFLVFHWPWLLVAKLWETRQVNWVNCCKNTYLLLHVCSQYQVDLHLIFPLSMLWNHHWQLEKSEVDLLEFEFWEDTK
jgi:hypothetical protein